MELLIGGEFSLIGQLKKGYPLRHPQGYVSFLGFRLRRVIGQIVNGHFCIHGMGLFSVFGYYFFKIIQSCEIQKSYGCSFQREKNPQFFKNPLYYISFFQTEEEPQYENLPKLVADKAEFDLPNTTDTLVRQGFKIKTDIC